MKRRIERMDVIGVQVPLAGTYTSAGIAKQAMKCVVTRLDISSGSLALPDGPGVGVSLDEAKLAQYRLG